MHILGVGLSRTGTRSLHRACLSLGFRSLHAHPERFRDVLRGTDNRPSFRIFDDVDAVFDLPAAHFYPELLAAYPDCKVILSVRAEDSWFVSINNHYARLREQWRDDPGQLDDIRRVQKYVYGSEDVSEFLYRKKFRDHNRGVVAGVPADRLLVIDVCAGEGWEKLCPFLGRPSPRHLFPWENRTPARSRSRGKATAEGFPLAAYPLIRAAAAQGLGREASLIRALASAWYQSGSAVARAQQRAPEAPTR
jgi:hypothetical protein